MANINLFTKSEKLKEVFEEIFPKERHNLLFTTDVDECMKKLYSQNIDGIVIDYETEEDYEEAYADYQADISINVEEITREEYEENEGIYC
jgi:NDP-sugar pyrophosphorylase family protein